MRQILEELELSKGEILSKYGSLPMRAKDYYEGYFCYAGIADDDVQIYVKLGPALKNKSYDFVDFETVYSLSALDKMYNFYLVSAYLPKTNHD